MPLPILHGWMETTSYSKVLGSEDSGAFALVCPNTGEATARQKAARKKNFPLDLRTSGACLVIVQTTPFTNESIIAFPRLIDNRAAGLRLLLPFRSQVDSHPAQ